MPSPSKSANGVRYILVALALAALACLIWRLSPVLIIAFGGIVVAALLRAMAVPLRRFSRLSDHGRIGIALAAFIAVIGGATWLFGRQFGAEADELRRLLPEQIKHVAAWLNTSALGQTLVNSIRTTVRDSKTVGGLGVAAVTVLGGALDAVLILFLGVYFALDPKFYLEAGLRLLPLRRRDQVRVALLDTGLTLRRWLLAQLVAMAIVGVLAGSALAIVGVPLALVLGALAGFLEFIPVVGPILFGIPAVLVAFSRGPRMALYALLAYILVQQLESNVIIPLLQRWAVKMPPVVSLLTVLVAGLLLGPVGIVFAAPLAVVAIVLVKHLYVEDALEHGRRD